MHMQAISEERTLGVETNSCGWLSPKCEGLLNLVKVIGCCSYREHWVSHLTVAAGFFLQSEGLLTLVKIFGHGYTAFGWDALVLHIQFCKPK
jgi:hypothetical protein